MCGVSEVYKRAETRSGLPKPKAQPFADNHAEAPKKGPVQRLSDIHTPHQDGAVYIEPGDHLE